MIRLTVLGSGSRGNACVLEADGATLLLDAGFSAREIERRAECAGVGLGQLAGIVLTHEHGDHAEGALRLAARRGVPVLTSGGTWHALGAPSGIEHRRIGSGRSATCGPFRVEACSLLHDAAEPLAVAATARGTRVAVAYDFGRPTQTLRYFLRYANAVVVESNYDEVLLRTSDYPASVQHRIAGSGGHLSNRATAALLEELVHPGLGAVVLAHLSQQCNTASAARQTVEPVLRAAGFTGTLAVAIQETPLHPIPLSGLGSSRQQPDLFDPVD
ncbi:MAG: MBL fold metallo-hydrolase [Gemmatimonadales bacterium]